MPTDVVRPRTRSEEGRRIFERLDDGRRCILRLVDLGVTFDVDRLRRERQDLIGELAIRLYNNGPWEGIRTASDGTVSLADFNLGSLSARKQRAQHLREVTKTADIDWFALIEELSREVIVAEREGSGAVSLASIDVPTEDAWEVAGVALLQRHPVILFGDGGAAKSYLALWFAMQLAARGLRVLYCDWEFSGEEHAARLRRLHQGAALPEIRYLRCHRPMVHEVDRIRRIVKAERTNYVICDSAAFAADGPPESAETAAAYFLAVRQFGVGSLHIAHVTKSEDGDQKPFGSVFYHNSARATWNAKRATDTAVENEMVVALYNRKSNIGPLRPTVGFRFRFEPTRTIIEPADAATSSEELAAAMHLNERIKAAMLSCGLPMSIEQLTEETGANKNSVTQALRRGHRADLFARTTTEKGVLYMPGPRMRR